MKSLRFPRLLVAFVFPILFSVAGISAPETEVRIFEVRGVVKEPYEDGSIVIEHEEIPGFMPAMTMPFFAKAEEARKLAAGDHVVFKFRVGETSSATDFRVLRSAAPARAEDVKTVTPTPVAARRLRPGDAVPAFSLLDHDSQTVTEAAFRRQRTVLTFIFTRCPVPEFCPRMMQKFGELQQQVRADPSLRDVRLWSITIDPQHDRPETLRRYADAVAADSNQWRFFTGEPGEIERLRRAFAVHAQGEGGKIDHTLATALINTNGRVVEIWRGNAWNPEEILSTVRSTAD